MYKYRISNPEASFRFRKQNINLYISFEILYYKAESAIALYQKHKVQIFESLQI